MQLPTSVIKRKVGWTRGESAAEKITKKNVEKKSKVMGNDSTLELVYKPVIDTRRKPLLLD